ncbi:Uma2 family endonuclease [Thiorhodococcus mannitoliphagus]|uniref:Uma2 family endonuclease n=1 Tax=Thiorhodococcus mannitoliphagus TaxID=329406 RepID=A0A6P1E5X8_9GAMM|nr:Uma2 family endonuclease [Thiorhodococcus mannitoliphagus]NEX23434.1 Uma2 family endonuclease [Thiorhodococcus mannitoliphagus]
MGVPQTRTDFSAADYLAWESEQPEKSEFFRGEVFAMGGASRRHVTVSGNVFSALDQAIEGSPCRAYMADMKLRVLEDEAYFYPDVLVTCDPADHRSDLFMSAPTLVVEVLSPSTAAFDRGEKFAAYRRIPSLREFVLIDPEKQSIEIYRRAGHDVWELHDIPPETPLALASLEAEIGWDRLFRNLD